MPVEVVRATGSSGLPVAAMFDAVLLDMLVDDVATVLGVEDILAAAPLLGLSLMSIGSPHRATFILSVVQLPRTPSSLAGCVLSTIFPVFPFPFAGLEVISTSWPPSLPGTCAMPLVRGSECNMVHEIVEESA